MSVLRLSLLIIFCLFSISCKKQAIQLNSGETVCLAGKITFKTYFGPPNFGEKPESDSKELTPLLILNRKIDFFSSEKRTCLECGVSKIQVVGNTLGVKTGDTLFVTGVISEAETGHHHTKVILFVDDKKLISEMNKCE